MRANLEVRDDTAKYASYVLIRGFTIRNEDKVPPIDMWPKTLITSDSMAFGFSYAIHLTTQSKYMTNSWKPTISIERFDDMKGVGYIYRETV